jgi:hypothetical protein
MSWIKDLYFMVFLLFFRFCEKGWSYDMNIAKALAGVTMVEGWLFIGAIAWLYRFTGNNIFIEIPRWAIYFVFLVLGMLTYYLVILRGRFSAFQKEFSEFAARRKALLTSAGIGLIVFSVTFAFFSATYAHSHQTR